MRHFEIDTKNAFYFYCATPHPVRMCRWFQRLVSHRTTDREFRLDVDHVVFHSKSLWIDPRLSGQLFLEFCKNIIWISNFSQWNRKKSEREIQFFGNETQKLLIFRKLRRAFSTFYQRSSLKKFVGFISIENPT